MEKGIAKNQNELRNEEGRESASERIANRILTYAILMLYAGFLIYGICETANPYLTTKSQATLIVLQCLGGLVLSIAPILVEKWFHIHMSFLVRFLIELFGVLGIIFGEGCQFYYRLSYWDDTLHFLSGFGVALLTAAMASNSLKDTNVKHKRVAAIFVGIASSFAIAFLWELMEYSEDCLFGTNMQKSIPEIGYLFNGGAASQPLSGTDEEIAAFFRTPEGYRYALHDTMSDLVDCFLGTSLFLLVGAIALWKKPHCLENMIEFHYGQTNGETAKANN